MIVAALFAAGHACAQPPWNAARPAGDGARPGNTIGTGQSLPRSDAASNLDAGTTRSELAPNLPSPPAGDDLQTLLLDARAALQGGRSGEAQEALERAETRALDRSVVAGTERVPAGGSLVGQIGAALRALAAGQAGEAVAIIDRVVPLAAQADIPR